MAETSRLRDLVDEVRTLEDQLRQGGGEKRVERQHAKGKMLARERIEYLLDEVFRPVGVGRARLARGLETDLAPTEVDYDGLESDPYRFFAVEA